MRLLAFFTLAVLSAQLVSGQTPPVVSNVSASQRQGTKLVDIRYDLSDADGDLQNVQVQISADGGLTYSIPCVTLSGNVGPGIAPGTGRTIVWNAGADWNGQFVPTTKVRISASDGSFPPSPFGMVLVPAGPFIMGDTFYETSQTAQPVRSVHVDSFFMDKFEVYFELAESVASWANANGYLGAGGSIRANPSSDSDNRYPIDSISWYNAIVFCNARSEMEGLTPAYYNDIGHTQICRSWADAANLTNQHVKWNANGYRLPTEAEWEKAARGGSYGLRYPWGNEIEASHANCNTTKTTTMKVGYYNGTQEPAGVDMANAYGLYDMCGNVREWCWDWFGDHYYGEIGNLTNPKGPLSGTARVMRGGSFSLGPYSNHERTFRPPQNSRDTTTTLSQYGYGFRCVRTAP